MDQDERELSTRGEVNTHCLITIEHIDSKDFERAEKLKKNLRGELIRLGYSANDDIMQDLDRTNFSDKSEVRGYKDKYGAKPVQTQPV